MERVDQIIEQMTLEEKTAMCSGGDFWHLKGIKRLGISEIMVSDGPHGLRKQEEKGDHLGMGGSIEAVCFPSASGLAASFDRQVLRETGRLLGQACAAEDVAVLLGPGINMKRSPLCGRNFEYLSEDPLLAGELAAAFTEGLQSLHTGACLKHYAANSQERRRSNVSAQVSERALREIYLKAFETVVKKSAPASVMCSYNRINGEYVAESRRLLTDILRDEWGFDGFVMTDWGACVDCVKGLAAGVDLEMPPAGDASAKKLAEAVKNGLLDEGLLDQAVRRIVKAIFAYQEGREGAGAEFDREKHHRAAAEIARQTMVLLKNDGALPLKKGGHYAFIGAFAKSPRYQGGGSSHVRPHRVTDSFRSAEKYAEITFAEGFEAGEETPDSRKLAEAVKLARECDGAVIFAGLSDAMESEAYDREHVRLPDAQNALISAVAAVQKNTVVVLHNGAPVEMPWIGEAAAVLEAYLAGEAVGEASADILFGETNPCGKLAETFPLRAEDNPAWLDFGGEGDTVAYGEGIYIGYRYYDKKKCDVLFPFGHGLSYTEFAYSDLSLDRESMEGEEELKVCFTVQNIGNTAGKEAAQIYVRKKDSRISRPEKELKGFVKVDLKPGEQCRCQVTLDRGSFAHYSEERRLWAVEPGEYEILVGASSRDIRLGQTVVRTDDFWEGRTCTVNTTIGELERSQAAMGAFLHGMKAVTNVDIAGMLQAVKSVEGENGRMARAVIADMPLRGLRSHLKGRLDDAGLAKIVDIVNAALNNKSTADNG